MKHLKATTFHNGASYILIKFTIHKTTRGQEMEKVNEKLRDMIKIFFNLKINNN